MEWLMTDKDFAQKHIETMLMAALEVAKTNLAVQKLMAGATPTTLEDIIAGHARLTDAVTALTLAVLAACEDSMPRLN